MMIRLYHFFIALLALYSAAALAQEAGGQKVDALDQFLQERGLAQAEGAPGLLPPPLVLAQPPAPGGVLQEDAGSVPYAPSAPPPGRGLSVVPPPLPWIAPLPQTVEAPALVQPAPAATSQEKMSHLVVMAMSFIDLPYRRGGTSRETGFDCSGFVRSIFETAAGVTLPRTSAEQARVGQSVRKGDLRPGDLVFFNTSRRRNSHVGIYVGDGRFIHSPSAGSHIRIEDMNGPYWKRRFNGARRVPVT